jgi:hypothetical protein
MVLLDLLTLAGIPTAVGASEAVHQQQLLDEEAEGPERQEPFYLDLYCDVKSRKKDEVHGAIIVLKDGKVLSLPIRSAHNILIAGTAPPMAQRSQNQPPKSRSQGW